MACSLLSIATVVHAQHIDKQTYTFAIKKADTLKLDKYVMIDQIQGTQSKPSFFLHLGEVSKAGEEIIPITFLIFIFPIIYFNALITQNKNRTQIQT